jgi:hypothetical protein
MKVHTLGRSIAILLLGTLASWTPLAAVAQQPTCDSTTTTLCITISTVNGDGTPFMTTLTGGAAVNLDADSPVGGPVNYGVFTIARCSGCAGRARAFVSVGSIDKLVLTDAQITNTSGTPQTLTITVFSGPLAVSGPAGDYPYAVELSGTFTAPLGAGPATDPANHIDVKATTSVNSFCDGPCAPVSIDNPALDPGEDPTVFPGTDKYSLIAPPFLAAGLPQFAPKEQQIITCNNVVNVDTGNLCQPALGLSINVSLKSRNSARLPGSIGAFHVASRCDPDSGDPALLNGCTIMADLFASLGPRGFKVYDVRMEPSPGTQLVDFRFGTPNSTGAWVTRRGGDDDDDRDDGNVSKTRVRLASNGSGEVRASGLCPASGCPSSNVLPVHVYCGQNAKSVGDTALQLNAKGDGRATLSFSLPCLDPAVLIMDPSDASWVAAPAIF